MGTDCLTTVLSFLGAAAFMYDRPPYEASRFAISLLIAWGVDAILIRIVDLDFPYAYKSAASAVIVVSIFSGYLTWRILHDYREPKGDKDYNPLALFRDFLALPDVILCRSVGDSFESSTACAHGLQKAPVDSIGRNLTSVPLFRHPKNADNVVRQNDMYRVLIPLWYYVAENLTTRGQNFSGLQHFCNLLRLLNGPKNRGASGRVPRGAFWYGEKVCVGVSGFSLACYTLGCRLSTDSISDIRARGTMGFVT